MRHLIKKQIVDLTLRRKQDAFRMQQLASEQYYRNMLPVMEKQFTEFSTEAELIQIDCLEIDLGDISEQQMEHMAWDHELVSRFAQRVKESLQQCSREKQLVTKTIPDVFCGQWIYYMQKGYLPWNAGQATKEWRDKVLETLAVDFKAISALRSLIRENRNAVLRMVMQHEPVFLIRLIEVLTAEKQTDLPAAIEEIYLLFQHLAKQGWISGLQLPSRKIFHQTSWSYILTISASRENGLTVTKLIGRLLQFHPGLFRKNKKIPLPVPVGLKIIAGVIKDLEQTAMSAVTEKDVKPVDDKTSQKRSDNNKYTTKEIASKRTSDITEVDPGETEMDILQRRKEQPGREDNISVNSTQEKIGEEGVFVVNAGIVLLHPFLKSFFNRLEMVKDGVFVDISMKQNALYLLHYLTTGQKDAEEHELVLPKILCDWPLGMPVEKEVPINDDAYEEAMSLLETAVEQWEILKNSSVSGLREGFLQRPGKIFTKNDNLYLHVERNAIDILLDHLPWNLSIIKLPWMKEILRVEWR